MATTAGKMVVALVMAMAGVAGHGSAFATPAPVEMATVVLHVVDYDAVPADELADAQKEAGKAYARIGIRLVWTDGYAASAASDSALHLDVTLLSAPMTARLNPPLHEELGRASRAARRAYIHHKRVVDYATKTGSNIARVLAVVLAHEVGHLLLPEWSHARWGLMRADWGAPIVDVPSFMPEQATTIRALLRSN